MRNRVTSAIARLEVSHLHPTNKQVIAETIRRELAEAWDCGATRDDAQKRVMNLLASDFAQVRIVSPFVITGANQFCKWSVVVQYPVGEPAVVDQDS